MVGQLGQNRLKSSGLAGQLGQEGIKSAGLAGQLGQGEVKSVGLAGQLGQDGVKSAGLAGQLRTVQLSLCMDMHRPTLVHIYIVYAKMFKKKVKRI